MRNVFVTGGAGYLGRAVLAWAARESPDTAFTIFSRDEGKHEHTRRVYPRHRYVLGDIKDYDRLEMAMAGHDTVIHAAAMKYVPQGEQNVSEAVSVNVEGSRNVALAAIRNRVNRVVGISTDKACQPVNVYGMTKLLMERLFQEADGWSDTNFNLTRYGNVVSSTGSVIPLFQRQAKEGYVTLTNPSMTRFWLSVDDAVQLLDQALREPRGGTVLIPRLKSLSMREVAWAAAAVAVGPDRANDLDYQTIGTRFGEKLHEDLLGQVEMNYAESIDANLMRMHVVTEGIVDNHVQAPYTSERPDREMTATEMQEMIIQADD